MVFLRSPNILPSLLIEHAHILFEEKFVFNNRTFGYKNLIKINYINFSPIQIKGEFLYLS